MTTRQNLSNKSYALEVEDLTSRYNNMLQKVKNMINTQGPIYSTWIRFQIGHNKPIVFDSSSTNVKENLIASLDIDKGGSGIANTFTLTVKYDPFNYGQNSQDKIEALDELLATAMQYDLNDESSLDDLQDLHGFLQYGYNYTGDDSIISPKYTMMLTDARSKVDVSSGITTYTFEGCSFISLDAEFTADFEAISEEDNKGLITKVCETLYYYYGTPEYKPSQVSSDEVYGSSPGYRIIIPDELFEDQPNVVLEATAGISPWSYCKTLLQDKMSKPDAESGKYNDVVSTLKPRYTMWVSDTSKCIYVSYVSPLNSDKNQHINYEFTWSTNTTTNIVTNWDPQVDLKVYLIQKMSKNRALAQAQATYNETLNMAEEVKNSNNNSNTGTLTTPSKPDLNIPNYRQQNNVSLIPNLSNNKTVTAPSQVLVGPPSPSSTQTSNSNTTTVDIGAIESEAKKAYYEAVEQINSDYYEMYDAELETLGIPSDPPLLAEVRVKPRILESVSRTAGVYIIQGASDSINTRGAYYSTLKLFRIRGL